MKYDVAFSDPGDIVCEPDEYAELVKELRASGIIKDHRSLLKSYKNSFRGREFVDWVVNTKELGISNLCSFYAEHTCCSGYSVCFDAKGL